MRLDQYLAQPGVTQAAFAAQLGVTQGAISQWLTRTRPVPLERCVAIEKATAGQVRCEELRPDMVEYFAYLRGLTEAEKP